MATGSDRYAYVTLLAPFLLEDELFNLTNNPSKILDYRVTERLSEAVIKQTCSYIFEGIPLTKLADGILVNNLVQLYDNFVLPKEFPKDARTGQTIPHKWIDAAYQSMYSELVLENNQILEGTSTVVTRCIVINANYIKVLNNSIIGFSPLLQKQIDTWSRANDGRFPSNKDFFGTPTFKADLIQFEELGSPLLRNPTIKNITVSSSGINLSSRSMQSNSPGVIEYYALRSGNTGIIDPVIGILQDNFPLVIRKEGGSYSSTTINDNTTIEVTITSMTEEGPLVGKAKPSQTLYVTFPNNVVKTALVDGYGNWTCTYPEPSYTPTELQTILVKQQDTKDTNVTTENSIPATVQTSYGLPVLDFKNNSFYSLAIKNAAQLTSKFTYAEGGAAFRYVFNKDNSRFALTAFYVGRPLNNPEPENYKFLSWPGSVIESTGVDIFIQSSLGQSNTPITPITNDVLDSSANVVSLAVGTKPYQNIISSRSFLYSSERLQSYLNRLTIPYEASYDYKYTILKIRYEIDLEERFYADTLQTSYEVELVKEIRSQLLIRYETILPESRGYRDFLSIVWEKELTQHYKNIVQTTWIKEKTYFITQEMGTSWESILVDRVIVKPFYMRLWDPILLKFNDCISFNVYGDPEKMQQYILNGELRYLFTNPPKYELVMFDYNLNPYSNIFLNQVTDPLLLEDFDDIPERYIMVGNYTIKDIDMNNSLSLDVIAKETQLNEYRSYWIPDNIEDYRGAFLTMSDGKSTLLSLEDMFRDDHHEDIVELDLIILDKNECCFTQSSVGSRCSPY